MIISGIAMKAESAHQLHPAKYSHREELRVSMKPPGVVAERSSQFMLLFQLLGNECLPLLCTKERICIHHGHAEDLREKLTQ